MPLILCRPYDKQFETFYLAYIAGIKSFGLIPEATFWTSTERNIPVHYGTLKGVLRELGNALVRSVGRPTVSEMTEVEAPKGLARDREERRGATPAFHASVFHDLVFLAASLRKLSSSPS